MTTKPHLRAVRTQQEEYVQHLEQRNSELMKDLCELSHRYAQLKANNNVVITMSLLFLIFVVGSMWVGGK